MCTQLSRTGKTGYTSKKITSNDAKLATINVVLHLHVKWHSKYLVLLHFKVHSDGCLVITLKNITTVSGKREREREREREMKNRARGGGDGQK